MLSSFAMDWCDNWLIIICVQNCEGATTKWNLFIFFVSKKKTTLKCALFPFWKLYICFDLDVLGRAQYDLQRPIDTEFFRSAWKSSVSFAVAYRYWILSSKKICYAHSTSVKAITVRYKDKKMWSVGWQQVHVGCSHSLILCRTSSTQITGKLKPISFLPSSTQAQK